MHLLEWVGLLCLVSSSPFYAHPQNACHQPSLLLVMDPARISGRLAFLLADDEKENIIWEVVCSLMSRWRNAIEKIKGKTGVKSAERKSEEGILLRVVAVMMVRMTGVKLFTERTWSTMVTAWRTFSPVILRITQLFSPFSTWKEWGCRRSSHLISQAHSWRMMVEGFELVSVKSVTHLVGWG